MKYYPRWCPKLLDRSSTCTTHCTWWGGCKYLGIKWKGGKCIDSKKWWNEWVIFFLKHWKMKQWNQIQMSWGKNISRLIYERVVLSNERISKGFFFFICLFQKMWQFNRIYIYIKLYYCICPSFKHFFLFLNRMTHIVWRVTEWNYSSRELTYPLPFPALSTKMIFLSLRWDMLVSRRGGGGACYIDLLTS